MVRIIGEARPNAVAVGHQDLHALQQFLKSKLTSPNLFHAIRIQGHFPFIKARAVRKQSRQRYVLLLHIRLHVENGLCCYSCCTDKRAEHALANISKPPKEHYGVVLYTHVRCKHDKFVVFKVSWTYAAFVLLLSSSIAVSKLDSRLLP